MPRYRKEKTGGRGGSISNNLICHLLTRFANIESRNAILLEVESIVAAMSLGRCNARLVISTWHDADVLLGTFFEVN